MSKRRAGTASAAAAAAAPSPAAPQKRPSGKKQAAEAEHADAGCCSSVSAAASSSSSSAAAAAHSHNHAHAPAGPPSFRCAVSQSMGRALVSTRAIAAGEIIHREWPLAHVQFAANARRAAVCQSCGRFVGSLLDQMQRVAGLQGGSEIEALPLFSAEDAQLTELVPCTQAPACDALYCSEAHRAADWKRGHKLLCVGVGPASAKAGADADAAAASASNKRARKDTAAAASSSSSAAVAAAPASSADSPAHPFAQFCAHAASQHEMFVLAARLVALIECGEASRDDLDKFVQRPWEEIVADDDSDEEEVEEQEEQRATAVAKAAAAAAAASGGKRKRDAVDAAAAAVAATSSSPEARAGSVRAHLHSVVSRSFTLLTSALYTHHSRPVPGWFTRAWYSRLVGALRLNALAVEHPTPLAEYVAAVDQVVTRLGKDAAAAAAAAKKAAAEADSADDDDDEEEAMEGGAAAAEQSSSSSSSDDDDDDDDSDSNNDDADDDDGFPSSSARRSQRFPEAAASAHAERNRILLALMPLVSRALMERLKERMARQALRARAREEHAAAAAGGSAASSASTASSGSEHARLRRPDRDSYPSRHFQWSLEGTAAQSVSVRFSTRLFPSFHGSALYATIAQANHSCEPNASVEHAQDSEGMLVATRDIAPGEQIMLSYIAEEGASKVERQEQLREYGFECRCNKCMSELSEPGGGDSSDEEN